MLCPKCHDQVLVVVDRDGIEIDYCGGCRGVWLDRGELDKLIMRVADASASADAHPLRSGRGEADRRNDDDDSDDDRRGSRRKRRGGFLGELLDFD